MSEDNVESFTSLFAKGFGAPGRIEKRIASEKRSSMSDRQRKRGAVRTAQINFRCSPGFKRDVAGVADHCDASIADVLEEALAMFAKAKGYKGAE